MSTERIATLRAGIETLLDDARADRDRLHAESARLQRMVDDLAKLVRERRRMLILKKDPPGGQRDYLWLNSANEVLEKHGLLRPCDDPAQVPSAMRAEVPE